MSSSHATKDSLVTMGKLAEMTGRFEDMVEFLVELVKMGVVLDMDEQNMLSIAFKNVVGMKRSQFSTLSAIAHHGDPADAQTGLAKEFAKKIEGELKSVCERILNLIDAYLLPSCDSEQEKIFYYKLQADYNRYLAETALNGCIGDHDNVVIQKSSEAYELSLKLATTYLEATNPLRLGIALNFSVFYYEIERSSTKACQIAKNAFEAAIADLDNLRSETYQDSTTIMQLLRDNLTLWTADPEEKIGHPSTGEMDFQEEPPEDLDRYRRDQNGGGLTIDQGDEEQIQVERRDERPN